MSTRPRNPRYFPKMKVRGASRRRQAPFQRLGGAFDNLAMSMASAAAIFPIIAAYPTNDARRKGENA